MAIAMQLGCYLVRGDRPTLEPLADLVLDSVGEFISQSGEFFLGERKSLIVSEK